VPSVNKDVVENKSSINAYHDIFTCFILNEICQPNPLINLASDYHASEVCTAVPYLALIDGGLVTDIDLQKYNSAAFKLKDIT
jgi:hypothetical protein